MRTRTICVAGLALTGLVAAGLTAAVPAGAATLAPVHALPAGAIQSGVSGIWIAVLKPGAFPATTRVAASVALAEAAGGTVLASYPDALAGFSVAVPSTAVLDAVRADPAIEFLEPDQDALPNFDYDPAATPPATNWALDRLDRTTPVLDGAPYAPAGTGADATVYVIDTGIAATNPEFGDGTLAGSRVVAGWSAGGGDGRQACFDHGTAVASAVGGATLGAAPAVTIVPVDVSWKASCLAPPKPRPDIDLHTMLSGIDWVTTHHVGRSVALLASSALGSQALDRAVSRSTTSGITYVTAAGDIRGSVPADACLRSPSGALANVVVGATATTGTADVPASFSASGPCVDVWAPGDAVAAPLVASRTARAKVWGTAMAAAYTAGVLAVDLGLRDPGDPARVVWELRSRSQKFPVTATTAGLVVDATNTWSGITLPDPCLAPNATLTGTLANGGSALRPAAGYAVTKDGIAYGCMTGPAAADFDLTLTTWDAASGTWQPCDYSWGLTSTEMVMCAVGVGDKVRYALSSWSGSGSYRLRAQLP